MQLKSINLDGKKIKKVIADGKSISFAQQGATVTFDGIKIKKELRFEV